MTGLIGGVEFSHVRFMQIELVTWVSHWTLTFVIILNCSHSNLAISLPSPCNNSKARTEDSRSCICMASRYHSFCWNILSSAKAVIYAAVMLVASSMSSGSWSRGICWKSVIPRLSWWWSSASAKDEYKRNSQKYKPASSERRNLESYTEAVNIKVSVVKEMRLPLTGNKDLTCS